MIPRKSPVFLTFKMLAFGRNWRLLPANTQKRTKTKAKSDAPLMTRGWKQIISGAVIKSAASDWNKQNCNSRGASRDSLTVGFYKLWIVGD